MFNVLIRPLIPEDAVISYRWRNNPKLWKFTGKRPDREITLDQESAWIQKVLKETDSYRFAIIVDSVYVGNIQLTTIQEAEKGEFHIFIGEEGFWGKGIATLATQQIIRFAREHLKLKQLYLTVNPDNKSAIRVYEKCGFVKESDEIRMSLNLSVHPTPIVSIFMMAYNHEPYIRQSIESVLFQKTSFDFELVIGEDGSTDRTRSIILDIHNQFPGKSKLLLHKSNIGAVANEKAVLSECKGRYIAFCEGDDYWSDPLKLQKQVDFLDKNPGFGMVCTDYRKYFQNTGKLQRNIFKLKRYAHEVRFEDYLLDMSSIGTATVLVRSELVRMYHDEICEDTRSEFIVGDTPLWLFIAAKSKIAVMPDETAVYRIRENSACHFKSPEDHYRFVEKGFSIADYFFGRYAQNIPDLGEKLEMKKLKARLFHAFRVRDKELARKVYINMQGHKVKVKQKIKAFILFKGAGNRIAWYVANILLKTR